MEEENIVGKKEQCDIYTEEQGRVKEKNIKKYARCVYMS